MTGRHPLEPHAPLVVKVGSSSLTNEGGGLSHEALASVVTQVAGAWGAGFPTVLVTSAAVAAGLPLLGLDRRPADLPGLQVAASVGQTRLMERYAVEFASHELVAGQVLLTRDVLANREQYLHAGKALERMLARRVVPIVNENDIVVVDELRLGDNDRLAAIVSHLVGAQILVLLTDTDGLYSVDPKLEEGAALLSAVRHTDEVLDRVAAGQSGPLGSGGVGTKVSAARMAAWSGIPTVIAPAADPSCLEQVLLGGEVGTWISPHKSGLSARKLWIAFGQPSAGRVSVDGGAVIALKQRRSLLPVGVTEVEGEFTAGDAVEIYGPDGLIAKGQVRVEAAFLAQIKGRKTSELDTTGWGGEVVHADDLVVLVG